MSPTPTRTADYDVLHQERSPAVVNCERSRLRRGKPHQHTSLLLSGSTDTVHSHHARHFTSLDSYLHTSTPPPPPINTNTAAHHPPATSSSPRDKGPCTSQQLAAEIILGAAAEVQLNSATDSTSVLGQAKAYTKTNGQVRANSTAQPAHSAQRRCNFRPARVRADVSS